MAKQIYIDSNGNEVLVSGTITNDNNLPHFSGTPTAGTTAYEIASIGGYSTTEKAIGTWTDGSTVYKKTVTSTSITSNSLNNIAHGITGLNRLIDISGNCIRADNTLMPIPRITTDGANGLISVSSVNATNIVLYVGFNYTGATAISEVALTLIYTKS